MRQVTCVAMYGRKPSKLAAIIENCQDRIDALTDKHPAVGFQRYEVEQVHATIIGLERSGVGSFQNLNFRKRREVHQDMDFAGLLEYFRRGAVLPFAVQIGGYQERDYPFVSRNQHPYDRSFSVQGDKAVVMGWPVWGDPTAPLPSGPSGLVVESRRYPASLDAIRRHCQHFGILHGYHRQFTDVDNDFYLRIGLFDPPDVPQSFAQQLEGTLRQFLKSIGPQVVQVTLSDLFAVAYVDDTLPRSTSTWWSFDCTEIDDAFIRSLYLQSEPDP